MRRRRLQIAAAVLVVALAQAAFGLHEVANVWQYGHIGYNSAAYHQAARNTLRWGELFPAQYVAGARKPTEKDLYAHAPLALHLHTVTSVALFGDARSSVRVVPIIHGVLAAVALLLLLLRFQGWPTALLGSAVYLLLPINSVYAHMSNHSTGFIFWSLLWLYCYLRWIGAPMHTPSQRALRRSGHRAWLAGIFGAGFMAMQWDWPAYYVAFAMFVHWLFTLVRRWRGRETATPWRDLGLLALFCIFVLASFGGFFALVYLDVGNLNDIVASYEGRSKPMPNAHARLWEQTLAPLFSPPLLVLAGAWLVVWPIRAALGRARARDLVPVAFAFAGITHTLLFRSTALIHMYWPWPLNPFVAIATAEVLLWPVRGAYALLSRGGASRSRAVGAAVLTSALVLGPFAYHYVPFATQTYREGRRLYGSFRFRRYDPGYHQMVFAERLREWTDPATSVMAHPRFRVRIHVRCTADRHIVRGRSAKPFEPRRRGLGGGWVFVGPARRTPRAAIVEAAAKHPYRQYGHFYMVDYRRKGTDVRIWNLVRRPAPWTWRYFVNPRHGPLEAVRAPTAEKALLTAVRQWREEGG